VGFYSVFVSGLAGVYGFTSDNPPVAGAVITPDGTMLPVRVEEVRLADVGGGAIYGAIVSESRTVRTTVDWWSNEEGWGALVHPDLPDGIFVHFSAIEMEGYKTLTPGRTVEAVIDGPLPFEQDGYRYAAKWVRPIP
jgi:CspA family cold shock protein